MKVRLLLQWARVGCWTDILFPAVLGALTIAKEDADGFEVDW
jgi:hypothetical protein